MIALSAVWILTYSVLYDQYKQYTQYNLCIEYVILNIILHYKILLVIYYYSVI